MGATKSTDTMGGIKMPLRERVVWQNNEASKGSSCVAKQGTVTASSSLIKMSSKAEAKACTRDQALANEPMGHFPGRTRQTPHWAPRYGKSGLYGAPVDVRAG